MIPYDVNLLSWEDFQFYWTDNLLIRNSEGEWARLVARRMQVEEPDGTLEVPNASMTLGDIEAGGGKLFLGRGFSSIRPSELFTSRDVITYTPPLGYMYNESGEVILLECTASRHRNRGLSAERVFLSAAYRQYRFRKYRIHRGVVAGSCGSIHDVIVKALNNGHPTGLANDVPCPLYSRPESRDALLRVTSVKHAPRRGVGLVWSPSVAILSADRVVETKDNDCSDNAALVYLSGALFGLLKRRKDSEAFTLMLAAPHAVNRRVAERHFSHLDVRIMEEQSDD